jgi:hypothetical protein
MELGKGRGAPSHAPLVPLKAERSSAVQGRLVSGFRCWGGAYRSHSNPSGRKAPGWVRGLGGKKEGGSKDIEQERRNWGREGRGVSLRC